MFGIYFMRSKIVTHCDDFQLTQFIFSLRHFLRNFFFLHSIVYVSVRCTNNERQSLYFSLSCLGLLSSWNFVMDFSCLDVNDMECGWRLPIHVAYSFKYLTFDAIILTPHSHSPATETYWMGRAEREQVWEVNTFQIVDSWLWIELVDWPNCSPKKNTDYTLKIAGGRARNTHTHIKHQTSDITVGASVYYERNWAVRVQRTEYCKMYTD